MKRKIYIVFAISCLGALFWLGYQNQRLNDDLGRTQAVLNASKRESEAHKRFMSEHSEPARATNPAPLPSSPLTASAARTAYVKPKIDAAWRAARVSETILRVEAKYGRFLLKLIDWPPEKLEALKRDLALNEVAILEAILTIGKPASEAGLNALQQTVRDLAAKNQELLKESLGEVDYSKLDAAEKMEPYRKAIDPIANAMRSKGVDVTEELGNSILAAYVAATQDAAREATPVDPKTLSPEEFAALKKQQTEAFRVRLLNKMSGVLDAKQLQIFMETVIEQSGG
ncbi:MAG: hypothetical protein WC378_03565 [Opitutaceae bacterium]|jgi:hypothetical protein